MSNLIQWILQAAVLSWEQFRKFFSTTWGVLLIFGGLAYTGLTLIGTMTGAVTVFILSALDGGASYGAGGAGTGNVATSTLALANTIFPLDEALQMMAAMVLYVWLPIGIYRLIKSWIPAGFAGGS